MGYAKSDIFSGTYGLPEVDPVKTVITRQITKSIETVGVESIEGRLVPVKVVKTKTKVLSITTEKRGRIDMHDHWARRRKGGMVCYDKTKIQTHSFVDSGKVKPKKWTADHEREIILHKDNQRFLETK